MNSTEKVSNEVRVKDEPMFYNQSVSNTRESISKNNQQINSRSNDEHSIKQEKRTREDITSDDNQPKKLKLFSFTFFVITI